MDHRKRILVVDDDDRVRFVLSGALRRLGDEYQIVTASNSREALDRAGEEEFDLLITDLRLPRSDGLALTSAFAKASPDTRVIWITAYGCHRFIEASKRLDVHQCLDKPLEINELRAAALEALQEASAETDNERRPSDGDSTDNVQEAKRNSLSVDSS